MGIKRNLKLRIISAVLLNFFLFFNYGSFKASAEIQYPQYKKLVNYSSKYLKSGSTSETALGQKTNYQPSKITVKGNVSKNLKAELLPSKFDLRDVGGVTNIRNQGNIGACWAFSSVASLESYEKYKTNTVKDYSEANMITNSGYDISYNQGGTREMSIAYLSRWNGPVLESNDPYPEPAEASNLTVKSNLPVEMHLKDAYYLPGRTSYLDNTRIKEAVRNYGAVSTAMDVQDGYYNSGTYAYYYNGSDGSYSCNHAINIIGWDDNYSADNFYPYKPAGNGAFICRNSWGTSFGDNGYFYISYYDTGIANEGTVYIDENKDDYSSNYSYDKYGLTNFIGDGSLTNYFANVFTAGRNEKIDAVSFYTLEEGAVYSIGLIKNFSGSFTGMTEIKSGTMDTAGYHTISIDAIQALTKGSKFAVIVKITNPSEIYTIPVEEKVTGYTSNASSGLGQSYVSSDGSDFYDLNDISGFSNANVCLKVFTNEYVGIPDVPLNVSGNYADNIVKLTWNAGAGASSYNIYRSISSDGGYIKIGNAVTNEFNDSSITLETTYYYRLTALNSSGESAMSPAVSVSTMTASLKYQAHVQSIGWQPWVSDGEMAGTSGKSLRVEALKINLVNAPAGMNILYRAHVQNVGWQSWVKNGELSGTTGRSLRIESIEIKLENAPAGYHVLYQGHVQNKGWLNWTADGASCGTTGESLRMEALRVKIVKADTEAAPVKPENVKVNSKLPGNLNLSWDVSPGASQYNIYRAGLDGNFTSIGATPSNQFTDTGAALGTAYQYKIQAANGKGASFSDIISVTTEDLGVMYQGHVQKIGWQSFVSDDAVSGTTGMGLRIEAIKILLKNKTPDINIVYRVHVQNIGWMPWVRDGALSGTVGRSLRIEAIEIKLENAPAGYHVIYQGHVQNIGWQNYVSDGALCGTTGRSLRVEALRIKIVKTN